MAIILKDDTTVLIQGITGREGSNRARYMQDYGTNVVAGVTPGRGGSDVWNIPVYNAVQDAIDTHGMIETSITFVPGPAVRGAVEEAVEAGIKNIVMPVERVPLHVLQRSAEDALVVDFRVDDGHARLARVRGDG